MLSDAKVKNAKPGAKDVKLSDCHGLYLLVRPSGGKCWRLKYRFEGKEKKLSLGTYPEVSLAEAREEKDRARKLLAKGIDPGEEKKTRRLTVEVAASNTFEVVARDWHKAFEKTWSEEHAQRLMSRLQANVFPWIGERPITEVKATEILAICKRVERRSLEVATRIKTSCGQIFRYAISTGRAKHNPVPDLDGALPRVKNNHYAAPTEPREAVPLLRAMRCYEGSPIVQAALLLAPLTFVRPGELRAAEWSEIDLISEEWRIPGEKMKMDAPHIVPLCSQAVQILRDLHPITGRGRFVFPSQRTAARPMSENTVNSALRTLGFSREHITGHGFRAMARTILDEVLGFRPDFIEHQLAHTVKDPNGRAYNRTSHLQERRRMMQTWADYLDVLRVSDGPFSFLQK